MDDAVDRHVLNTSDNMAVTAEVLGHTVMSQFPVTISSIMPPSVESESHAHAVKDQIDAIYQQAGVHPLVFYSITLPEIRSIILQGEGLCQDIVQALVAPLQHEMKLDPTPIAHRTRSLNPDDLSRYDARIAAIDYTLAHDDGTSSRNLDQAQVIPFGVSRCGKTPTSLYLVMQFGIRTASYLFIADDMDNLVLPTSLKPLQHRLFGLTIEPKRLATIREEHREDSRYASLHQCRMEVAEVEALYQKNQIPWLSSTNYSVEEIAIKILDIVGLNCRMYQNASALVRFFVIMLATRQDERDIVMHTTSRQSCR